MPMVTERMGRLYLLCEPYILCDEVSEMLDEAAINQTQDEASYKLRRKTDSCLNKGIDEHSTL